MSRVTKPSPKRKAAFADKQMKKKRKVWTSPDIVKPKLQMVTPEMKYVDVPLDFVFGNEDSLSYKINQLNDINKGTDRYNRIGRSVNVKHVQLRGQVYLNGTIPPNDHLHMLLVYSTQGIPTLYSNLYSGIDFTGTSTSTSGYRNFNFRNPDTTEDYKILWSRYCRITDSSDLADNTQANNLHVNVSIPVDILTKYDNVSVSGRDGSILAGSISFICQGLTQPIASSTLSFIGIGRIAYLDV